jgi:hypothetical protein
MCDKAYPPGEIADGMYIDPIPQEGIQSSLVPMVGRHLLPGRKNRSEKIGDAQMTAATLDIRPTLVAGASVAGVA